MKAIFKPTPQLAFEVTGEDTKALFRQIADLQEVFAAEARCGACGSEAFAYVHRQVDDFHYYELRCRDCKAAFRFGQAKKGGALFPKRKDEDGRELPRGGWSRYEPGQHQGEPAPAPAPAERRPSAAATIAEFTDWRVAQDSKAHWGDEQLKVGGKLYRLVDGQYRDVAAGAAGKV